MKTITEIMNESDTPTLADECRKLGLNYSAVVMRIRSGWSREEALTKPINTQRKHQLNGKEVKIKQYCEENELDYVAVRNRIHQSGMKFEDAVNFEIGHFKKKYELYGKKVSIRKECIKRGLNYNSVIGRILRGKSPEDALINIPKKNQKQKKINKKTKQAGKKQ